MGGDWNPEELLSYIKMAKEARFTTAVYVGGTTFYVPILEYLDFIKTGAYIESLGGLSSRDTNQKMWKKENNDWIDMTSSFWR
jgi:anaerobic ribonucleoside-triphosphate reductase activating protein